ncbi:hypothetical protein C0J52_18217 [Blattella germanica]|nr:hypothetical protein C0J52_18217 [Blattella germanica]
MRRHMFQCLWRHVKQKRPYNAATAFQVQENVSYQIKRNSSHGVAPAKSSISGQLNLDKQHLEVSSQSWPQSLKLSYVWLRDHCRCYKCYNHTTNQRSLDLLDIPPDIQPESSSIKDNELEIRWMDGHVSRYLLHWLWDNTYNQYVAARTHDYQLWSKESKEIKKIAQEDVDHFMATEKGLFDVVKSLVDFGVGFVTNVPATVNATEMVVKRIAHVQQTMFGGMWEFSDRYAHYDTAYTHQALGAHNDNTYFTEAAG